MFSKVFFAGILAGSAAFCEVSQEPDLPPNIKKIFEKVEDEVAKNRQKYDEANKKVFDKYEKQLRYELDKLTKAGEISTITLIKNEIDNFRTNTTQKVEEQFSENKNINTKNPPIKIEKLLLGSWKCDNKNYIFGKNGEMISPFKEKFSWLIVNNFIIIKVGISERTFAELSFISPTKLQGTIPNTTTIITFEKMN